MREEGTSPWGLLLHSSNDYKKKKRGREGGAGVRAMVAVGVDMCVHNA